MRNVIIFGVQGARYAVELRWVREVITVTHVTPVPGAPSHIAGAINVRGTITPVLDIGGLCERDSRAITGYRRRLRAGDSLGEGAVLMHVDDVALALLIAKVDEVVTADEADEPPADACAGALATTVLDSRGHAVPLIDPPALVRISLAAAHALAAHHSEAGDRASFDRITSTGPDDEPV